MQLRHIVGIAIIIAIMGGITFFSAQTARESDAISRGIVKTAAIKLNLLTEEQVDGSHYERIQKWDHILRKVTHFAIYFILALVIYCVLYAMTNRSRLSAFAGWFIATVFASIDEYHQTFVNGRGGQMSDVILDSLGALTAIVVGSMIIWVCNRKQRQKA